MENLMKNKLVCNTTLIIMTILVSGCLSAIVAQDRYMGGAGITIFDDRDFRGKSATYTRDIPDLKPLGMNDRASSLRVGAGEQWEVCEDSNYQGRCVIVSGEERDLRENSWNDMISSMRRTGGGQSGPGGSNPYLILYSQSNYRGSRSNYDMAAPNLYGWNGRARSVTIGAGVWELCEGINYSGRCITMERSSARIPASLRIASVRPRQGTVTPGPAPSGGYIVLYDQPNYRGNPTNYNTAASNLNRRAQSVTIGAGSWQFCEGANFTGRCVTLDRSTPNLSSVGMNRRVASVRPADFAQPGPQPGPDWYIVLYTQANYRGTPTNYRNAQPRITKTTGSVTVGQGVWEICSGVNYTGNCQTLNSNVPNMTMFGIFGRTIRSVRPVFPQPR